MGPLESIADTISRPFRYFRNWSRPMHDSHDESGLEISDNDGHDSMFDEIFGRVNNLWSHLCRSTRMDAEEKVQGEVQNSPHALGAVKRIANDVLGPTGPTFQILPSSHFNFTQDEIEEYQDKLHQWLEDMDLARKAKCIVKSMPVRGEGIGYFDTITGEVERENFDSPLAINFFVRDARRLDTELPGEAENRLLNRDSEYQEGIKYDAYDQPTEYRFDKRNIGAMKDEMVGMSDSISLAQNPDFVYIAAKWVVHLFHHDCAEQRRGFTQMSSSVLPSSLARKASMSIGKSIRKAAQSFGFIQQPELPSGTKFKNKKGEICEASELERGKPGTGFKIRDGLIKFLGGGMEFKAFDQKLPASGSESFLQNMIGWLGSALCAPLFWITGDFSKTNFTSGRMGLQGMDAYRDDIRDMLRSRLYKKAIQLFHERAPQIPGFFSEGLLSKIAQSSFSDGSSVIHPKHPKFKLHWPSRPAISPLVEARGKQVELMLGTKSHAELSEDADVTSRWKCEAEQYGISYEQMQRINLATSKGLTAEQLDALLAEDEQIVAESESTEEANV